MVYTEWKIDYVPFESGTWNESKRETLTQYRDVMLRQFLGDTKDSFEFKLTNINGNYDTKFNPNDKIYIYRGISTDTVPTDPEMVGLVRDNPIEKSSSIPRRQGRRHQPIGIKISVS